jgi:hypothetical protein
LCFPGNNDGSSHALRSTRISAANKKLKLCRNIPHMILQIYSIKILTAVVKQKKENVTRDNCIGILEF